MNPQASLFQDSRKTDTGSTHALYIHQSSKESNSIYTGEKILGGKLLGREGRYVSDINPKFFANFGYARLVACRPGGKWGFAHILANHIGKGFLVEANTTGLNFTGVNQGRSGQGLPKLVPARYKGNVYLQDTDRRGQWNFYRGE